MDIVITYVDGRDPVWQKDYEKYTNKPLLAKRFRDWGTLRYLMRGIEVNMPFVRNLYLVVSHESQVPKWVDKNVVKVVLHKDFIPEEHAPTFNSTTLGLHLHRIEGLSDEYIYFNDDIFPLKECRREDFFRKGKVRIGISRHMLAHSMYKQHCKQSNQLARRFLGKGSSLFYIRAQHCCIPILRGECEKIYESLHQEIEQSLTRVRSEKNLNMSLYMSYLYYTGKVTPHRIPCKHISLGATSLKRLTSSILTPSQPLVCINDVQMSEERFEELREVILSAFEKRFPQKSRFEI